MSFSSGDRARGMKKNKQGDMDNFDTVTQVLLNLEDSNIESTLSKLNRSDFYNGILNQSFKVYLKQFSTKKRIIVLKNIIFKCLHVAYGDHMICKRMVNQLMGKEVCVQLHQNITKRITNDKKQDMSSEDSVFTSVFEIVEKNLKKIFEPYLLENESSPVKLDKLPEKEKVIPKSSGSNVSIVHKLKNSKYNDQSTKKHGYHQRHKKKSNKLQKSDKNTTNKNHQNMTSDKNRKVALSSNNTSEVKNHIITEYTTIDLSVSDDEIFEMCDKLKKNQPVLSKKSVKTHLSEKKLNDSSCLKSLSNRTQNLCLAYNKETKESMMEKYEHFKTIVYQHYKIYHIKIIDHLTQLLKENNFHLKIEMMWHTDQTLRLKQTLDKFIKLLDNIKYKRIVFIASLNILFRNVVDTRSLSSSEVHNKFLKFANVIRKCKNEDFWISLLTTGWDDCFFGDCALVDCILHNNSSCELIHPAVNSLKTPSFQNVLNTNHCSPMCSDIQDEHNTDHQLEPSLLDSSISNPSKIATSQAAEINVTKHNTKTKDISPITSSRVNAISGSNDKEVLPKKTKTLFSSHSTIQQLFAQAPKYSSKIETKKVASTDRYKIKFSLLTRQEKYIQLNIRKNTMTHNETQSNKRVKPNNKAIYQTPSYYLNDHTNRYEHLQPRSVQYNSSDSE